MFLHAALDRFLTQMGNSYSGTKPALPTLNINKAKQLNQDTPDDLYVGSGHPARNVVPLSARLPGSARKLPATTAQQQQQLLNSKLQESSRPGIDFPSPHRLVANNILAKPQVPQLNMGGHEGSFGSGHSPATARPAGGPGSLPHVPQHRTPNTSRPAFAAASSQAAYAGTAERAAPAAVETGPITPAQALKRYGEYLTAFEQSEVLQYQQVWFLGKADVQKAKGNPHLQKTNFGYDDERGDYQVVTSDHIAYRYEVQGVLGKGSFGQVLKVLDYKTGTYKALKIIRNKKRFHHQAQVELKVLQHLRHNDPEDAHNVIHIQEHFHFRNHLCITFELLSINLYEFIKQNNFQGLSLQLIRRFAQQMLVSLRFLHQHSLIHCDLKPENILLMQPSRSAIKVIDFGSSCFVNERMYTYVQSRFYRSPEVIMGLPYGCEIDMWSFGCILAELYMGYPLFPGEDEVEQLLCIMEVMGVPPPHLIDTASRRKVFFDTNNQPTVVPNSRGKMRHPGAKSLWGVLRCKDPGFVDLLEGCLRWDPAERMTPQEAMNHPWLADMREQQQGSSAYRQPAGNTTQRTEAGSLQPSSVLAAASALAAAAAAGFTGAPASSTVIAAGKSGSTGKPASNNIVPGPAGASTPGSAVCSGEPAAQAASAAWLAGAGAGGSGLHTSHVLQHRSSGGNDTVQSGIDCTPRSGPVAGSGGSISTAAPMVLSVGSSLTAQGQAGSGLGAQAVATAMDSTGSGTGTPRAMETDAPGGLSSGLKAAAASALKLSAAVNIVAAGGADMQQQPHQQQQQAPAVLSAHQRHSSGGLDVLTTNGMRNQADQAALVATGTPIKLQPVGSAPAATAAGGLGSSVASFLAAQQQKQQQQYNVNGGAWTAAQAPAAHGVLHDNGSFAQQQHQHAMLLQQQLMQQQLDMTVVGQGVSNSGNKQHQQQQHLGSGLMDRLLPRLQH